MLMRRNEAKRAQVEFRFESTVMDGTPVFYHTTDRTDRPDWRSLVTVPPSKILGVV